MNLSSLGWGRLGLGALAALAVCVLLTGDADGQRPGSSSSSRPSSSPSFRPSSSPSFKPSSSPPSSKPSTPPSSGPSFKPGGSTTPSSKPATPPSSNPSFKPGGSSSAPPPSTSSKPGSTSSKPGGSGVTSSAAAERQKEISREAFRKAPPAAAPAPTFKSASGKEIAIKKDDPQVAYLRGRLDQSKWESRNSRVTGFYGVYYSRPVVVYHDPYPSFFWWWLLDRSLDERAMWAYHHKSNMDEARYRELLAKDAQLEARIRALEQQGVKKNPAYTPAGMTDPDLMYSDEYVKAVYNPVVPPAPPMPRHAPRPYTGPSFGTVVLWVLGGIFFLLLLWFLIWLLTQKRW